MYRVFCISMDWWSEVTLTNSVLLCVVVVVVLFCVRVFCGGDTLHGALMYLRALLWPEYHSLKADEFYKNFRGIANMQLSMFTQLHPHHTNTRALQWVCL